MCVRDRERETRGSRYNKILISSMTAQKMFNVICLLYTRRFFLVVEIQAHIKNTFFIQTNFGQHQHQPIQPYVSLKQLAQWFQRCIAQHQAVNLVIIGLQALILPSSTYFSVSFSSFLSLGRIKIRTPRRCNSGFDVIT